mmetsp:Transcript_62566/g.137656  ORF Transcript_62566/g.137656 Transcript_62566/m.137656 type:complete len:238 (+) Transcript_62566:1837-2550(+)
MVVPTEHQLLLPVAALVAVVPPIHGHEIPAWKPPDEVADLRREEAQVVLALPPALLKDALGAAIEAVAEVLVSVLARRFEVLFKEIVEFIEDAARIPTDLDATSRAQLDHAMGRNEVHRMRGFEDDLLLTNLPLFPDIAAIDDPERPAELVGHEIHKAHGREAHVAHAIVASCPVPLPAVEAIAERHRCLFREIAGVELAAEPCARQPLVQGPVDAVLILAADLHKAILVTLASEFN